MYTITIDKWFCYNSSLGLMIKVWGNTNKNRSKIRPKYGGKQNKQNTFSYLVMNVCKPRGKFFKTFKLYFHFEVGPPNKS